jgi:hypothetical protein
MFTRSKHIAPRAIAPLGMIMTTAALAIALPMSGQTSTVFDPIGDVQYHAPAFQDIVLGQLTKTADGDFEFLMEMADAIPANPPMPPPANREIWWFWGFDLDPAAIPQGYPSPPGIPFSYEFMVYVSWNGAAFAGTAIDRRPLLIGGEAIVTPVAFSINGTTLEAFLPFELIGDVPPSFRWHPRIFAWSGRVGSFGFNVVDSVRQEVFNP